jgi:hypothetical protein
VNRGSFSNGTAWVVDSQYNESRYRACRHNAINATEMPASFATNNSAREQYVNDPITMTSTTV